jgi:acetylornithine deacetylase/succinyl-diaminopimelate desuccinylase-like protein
VRAATCTDARLDDKDNLTAGLMTMLLLKRGGPQLDRDVILLAEAAEEISTRVGIELMVNQHFSDIDAEYCLAEGNGPRRIDGSVKYATVLTGESEPRHRTCGPRALRPRDLPLQANAIVRLARHHHVRNWPRSELESLPPSQLQP